MEEMYSSRKGKKCVIYIRVSSERQVQGYSLEGQKRYLKEWAEFEGMTVSEIYVEPGKSGKSITGREVASLFEKYGVFDYLAEFYDVLHTTDSSYINHDIDSFIAARQ